MFTAAFIIESLLLGVGLAMDAFSVSLADGLAEPAMKRRKRLLIAGTFAVFQALMPMLGWVCVHTVVEHFRSLEKFIPWVALVLLCFIGGKMLVEGLRGGDGDEVKTLGFGTLMVQGVATAIDALSVGFTIADQGLVSALVCAGIIAAVTFVICIAGVNVGRKFGTWLSGKATVVGGAILIAIGIEIFVRGIA